MNRLTLLHINIIGAVVVLITGAALYFTVISSANDGIAKAKTEFEGVDGRFKQLDAHRRVMPGPGFLPVHPAQKHDGIADSLAGLVDDRPVGIGDRKSVV